MFEDPYKSTGTDKTAEAAARLAQLPTLEDTETRLGAAIEELGSYVSSLVSGLTWQWTRERSTAECDPPFDRTRGSMVYLRNYVSHPAIPEDVWPRVLDRARRLAAGLGATGSEVFADEPGNHTVRFYSTESTELSIGTRGAVIGGVTGCRLPAAEAAASTPTTRHR